MDTDLEKIFNEWENIEKENMVYQEIKKTKAILLILNFFQFMIYYFKIVIDYLDIQKKKIDKQYYTIEDID